MSYRIRISAILLVPVLLAAAGCGSGKECMSGTLRCNSENNVEMCASSQTAWEFNKQCPKVQTCRGGHCLVVPKSCGNGKCEPKGETCNICPADCGACCGNGACEKNYGEDRYTCKKDCKPLDQGVVIGDKGGPAGDGPVTVADQGGGPICAPDCKTLNFPGVTYSCKLCSNGKTACQANRKSFISGSATELGGFSYSYGGYYGCDTQKAFATAMFQGSTFNHMVTPNGNGSMPILSVQIKNHVSGQQHELAFESSGGTSPVIVSLVLSTSPSLTCSNVHASVFTPPSKGSVKVTTSGTAKGSSVNIAISGHLLCYQTGGQNWQAFSYTAQGIIF